MKYKTIVIDPPWKPTSHGSDNVCGSYINLDLPYKQMSDDEIIQFPINDFTDNDCACFIWSTHFKLPIAFKVLEKWCFKYHCLFTWYKNTGLTMKGIFRNSEFILFGYRGRFPFKNKGYALRTTFEGKTNGNSVKPNEFYEMIRAKTPEPRIDIFARKRHKGFDAYGDQVEPNIQEVLIPTDEMKRDDQ